jgi:hypothetical protein
MWLHSIFGVLHFYNCEKRPYKCIESQVDMQNIKSLKTIHTSGQL